MTTRSWPKTNHLLFDDQSVLQALYSTIVSSNLHPLLPKKKIEIEIQIQIQVSNIYQVTRCSLVDLRHNGFIFVSTICRWLVLPIANTPKLWRTNSTEQAATILMEHYYNILKKWNNTLAKWSNWRISLNDLKGNSEDWKVSSGDWWPSIPPPPDHLSNSSRSSLWYIPSQFSWVGDILGYYLQF